MHDCHAHPAAATSRRDFVRLAGLGAGVALYGLTAPRPLRAAGHVEAVLLSCMDYRLLNDIVGYMDGRGLRDQYDHLILAGASLGAITRLYPDWGRTFWDHVDVAVELHDVQRVIVMDHRDCGAYKLMVGMPHMRDWATETAAHAEQLLTLREQVAERHPSLPVELLLMSLDGSVETIA